MEQIHNGILKGNQKYAYYAQRISSGKTLKIKNGNSEVVKQGNITKDINYIFYSSSSLDNNYKFYIYNKDGSNEKELKFSFGNAKTGDDDQDIKTDDGGQSSNGDEIPDDDSQGDKKNKNEENKSGSSKAFVIVLSLGIVIVLIIAFILVYRIIHKKNSDHTLMNDINKELLNKETVN